MYPSIHVSIQKKIWNWAHFPAYGAFCSHSLAVIKFCSFWIFSIVITHIHIYGYMCLQLFMCLSIWFLSDPFARTSPPLSTCLRTQSHTAHTHNTHTLSLNHVSMHTHLSSWSSNLRGTSRVERRRLGLTPPLLANSNLEFLVWGPPECCLHSLCVLSSSAGVPCNSSQFRLVLSLFTSRIHQYYSPVSASITSSTTLCCPCKLYPSVHTLSGLICKELQSPLVRMAPHLLRRWGLWNTHLFVHLENSVTTASYV